MAFAQLTEETFPIAEGTPLLSPLFPGALRLAMDLNLPFTSNKESLQTAIPDSRFVEEVRGFIRDGNDLAIRYLVRNRRWDRNLPYKNGSSGDGSDSSTILHMAAEVSTDDFEIPELIVQKGADLERTDGRVRTAVYALRGDGAVPLSRPERGGYAAPRYGRAELLALCRRQCRRFGPGKSECGQEHEGSEQRGVYSADRSNIVSRERTTSAGRLSSAQGSTTIGTAPSQGFSNSFSGIALDISRLVLILGHHPYRRPATKASQMLSRP